MTIRSETPKSQAKLFDTDLELKDSGAVTADGAASVGGSAQELDIGLGKVEGDCVIDVTAIDVVTGDETYDINLQGSTDSFVAVIAPLASLKLGADITDIRDPDSLVGRYTLPFNNVHNNTHMNDIRIFTDVTGTTPSITFSAFLALQG